MPQEDILIGRSLPGPDPVAHYPLQHSVIVLISYCEGLSCKMSLTQYLGLDECHTDLHSPHGTSSVLELEISQIRVSHISRWYSLNVNEL